MKFIVVRKNALYKFKKYALSKNSSLGDNDIGSKSKKPKQLVSAFDLSI